MRVTTKDTKLHANFMYYSSPLAALPDWDDAEPGFGA
jgi:hypothetical protein